MLKESKVLTKGNYLTKTFQNKFLLITVKQQLRTLCCFIVEVSENSVILNALVVVLALFIWIILVATSFQKDLMIFVSCQTL